MVDGITDIQSVKEADRHDISVKIFPPNDQLLGFVTFHYIVESATAFEDFLYPEWGHVRLRVNGEWRARVPNRSPDASPHATLSGPTDRLTHVSTTGGKLIGFGLTPFGWQRFLPMPADHLANRVTALGDWFGIAADDLREELKRQRSDRAAVDVVEGLLLAALDRSAPNPEWARDLNEVLRNRPRDVAEFAARVGLPERTLGRRCKRLFGFAPKRLLRRQRLLDTFRKIRMSDQKQYSALLDPEYFDQAHFVHEFRDFMGFTPTELLAIERPLMSRAEEAQVACGIPLLFEIPKAPE